MSREVFLYEEQRYYKKANSEIYDALQALAEEEAKGARYYVVDPILDKRQEDDYFLVEQDQDRNGELWVKSKFVGFIYYKGKILVSLPKYVPKNANDAERMKIYQDICVLLYHYRNTLKDRSLSTPEIQDMTREVELAEKLGELYQRNGLYTVPHSSYTTVSGRVLWGRTVAKQTPVLCDARPIYFRRERRIRRGEENEISELQKALLYFLFEERGYRFLLPGYPAMEKGGFSWDQVLENADFYRARLWNERQMVFDEDRVDLLETMLEFLNSHAENGRGGREDHCEVYGVAHFEDLFERLLGECLKNQIGVQKVTKKDISGKITRVSFDSKILGKIDDINGNPDDINADPEIISWSYNGGKSRRGMGSRYAVDWNRDISVPDVVYELPERGVCMLIDAKYYNIHVDGGVLSGYPGRDSVLKQLHYKRLLESLYDDSASDQPKIYNLFLLPDGEAGEGDPLFRRSGEVKYPGEEIFLINVNMERLIRETLRGNTGRANFQEELWRAAVEAEEGQSKQVTV